MSIEEALEQVIIKLVKQLSVMLGTPNDIPETAHQLAIRILSDAGWRRHLAARVR
ncbi:hypothetical protein [Aeromonas jandaei]|uniref:hypothetical protein n=1 Tax=Aeromonas jandaei TaxID=650 RepID=UPI0038E1D28A